MHNCDDRKADRHADWPHLDRERIERPLPPEARRPLEACISHARDLICAADALQERHLYNLAYHMATLCLEELGKAHLLFMNFLVSERSGETRGRFQSTDDHVKKLFWSLFAPMFGKEPVTKKSLEAVQGLATRIHGRRLRGLYVEPQAEDFSPPRETVSENALADLMGLARARLDIERPFERAPLTDEESGIIDWYVKAGDDLDKRAFMMSVEAMEKLVEIGNGLGWMKWMKEKYEDAEREALALARRELERTEPSEAERLGEKWKLRIRLVTASHSLRRNDLVIWNAISQWIKLVPVDTKKDEVLVEFTLPKCIPVHGVWSVGMDMSRKFVIALNIGTMGFFWWHMPRDVSRYYERLIDLETDREVVIERNPKLLVDWPHKRLSQQMLHSVALAFGMIPKAGQNQGAEPFNRYAVGLALMARNDVHLQLEVQAFVHFYGALKTGMCTYGDWDGKSSFRDAMHSLLDPLLHNPEEVERYYRLGDRPTEKALAPQDITLREVACMKLLADAYFGKTFQRMAADKQSG
ncbi:MAG: AbiV family abortive infection protein [Planctomycetaceae bacterium]|nr:AbiV family abortive infection protein [Planctomycetaceae bacterium]